MDIIQSENIKVPNSVLVSGLSGTDVDDEVVEFLERYGSVERVVKIDSSDANFKNTAVVEFQFGTAIQQLQSDLPCHRPSSDPNIIHHIHLLSSIYTANVGSTLTQSYLSELKDVAKMSGADFEKVLLEELARIQRSAKQDRPVEHEDPLVNKSPLYTHDAHTVVEPVPDQTPTEPTIHSKGTMNMDSIPFPLKQAYEVPASGGRATYQLAPEQLTTPEVQRVVVEHIVKSKDMLSSSYSFSKWRLFSGKTPCPNLEVDYDTWRSNAEFYLTDNTVSDKQVVRKISESLLPPAANVVKHLGPLSSSREYLSVLDSAYGTVDDGDELFAAFLNTNQNTGEKPSAYLHRLQATLSNVVKRNGIAAGDSDRQLLKQFCRGCWNNSFITNLQLEQKKYNPPSFPELLLILRTEEDKQTAKSCRMRQHLGCPKTKVQSNSLNVYDFDTDEKDIAAAAAEDNLDAGTQKMKKQIAQLQTQLATLKASMDESSEKATIKTFKSKKYKPKEPAEKPPHQNVGKSSKKPRPWYCFNCGEDGHIAPTCSNESNPVVVEAKRKELREKQQVWEAQTQPELN